MNNLWVVFLTGLTTGGLSCLAVQGGLLASSIAKQAEEDIEQGLAKEPEPLTPGERGARYLEELNRLNQKRLPQKELRKALHRLKNKYPVRSVDATPVEPTTVRRHHATPIALFLGSKLVAYTLFGFLLGWLGSVLQLTPLMRAMLQIGIGIFMVGTALRMLHVHPIFRHFVIEPPKFITRFIRRYAKNNKSDVATPIFLGALTIFIPCGVTQVMMALAISSGSPVFGAATMFAFTLGTTPIFFTLAYLATRLGETMQVKFLKVAAVAIFILALVSIEGGLNLMGSPISYAAVKKSLTRGSEPSNAVTIIASPTPQLAQVNLDASSQSQETPPASDQQLTVKIDDWNGYTPDVFYAKADQPIKLALVTNKTRGCGRAFLLPDLNIQKVLPETGTTMIDIPPQKTGKLYFTCSMGMFRGEIIVS